jgi:hypothetical protein
VTARPAASARRERVSDPNPIRSDRARVVLACLALATCVLALFGRTIQHPFIAFDDAEYILRNPQVTQPLRAPVDLLLTPKTGYVIPVTVGFEAVLHALSGGRAWSFHAAALLLHALFAVQLLLLARRLGTALPAAFAGAVLFAVHPLVLQPVAWAICIKDLLMANLLIAATHAFLSATRPHAQGGAAVLAVVLALLAMLAKPSAALVGFAWLGSLFARGAAPDGDREHARPKAALGAGVITALLGLAVGAASRFAHDTLLESARTTWSPWKAVEVLGRQLWHVLWPVDLLIVYPDPVIEPSPWLKALGLCALAAIAFGAVRMRRAPALLLPALIALATYLPTSNVLPFARTMSDSYMYVPLAGMALLFGAWLARRFAVAGARASRLAVAVAAVALALAASTSAQLPRWRGGAALWEPVVRRHPRLATAHRLMGDEFVWSGRPDLAVEPYRRAFALDYDRRFLLEYGTVLSMAGRLADAECVLIEAVAFGTNSGYAVYNYAALLAFHAGYKPRYPGAAKQLLGRLDALRSAGKVQWPPALEAGLKTQIERVRAAPPPPSWRQRGCAMLERT